MTGCYNKWDMRVRGGYEEDAEYMEASGKRNAR